MSVSAENRLETLVWILISSTSKDWKYWVLLDQRACSSQNWTQQNKNSHWTSWERKRTSRKHYYYKINIKSHRSWKILQRKHSWKIWTTTNQYSINALIKSNSWTLCYTLMSGQVIQISYFSYIHSASLSIMCKKKKKTKNCYISTLEGMHKWEDLHLKLEKTTTTEADELKLAPHRGEHTRALEPFLSERRPVSVSHMNSAAADAQQINIWCVFSLFIMDEINSPLMSRERARPAPTHRTEPPVLHNCCNDRRWRTACDYRAVSDQLFLTYTTALLHKLSVSRSSQCDPVLLGPKCSVASRFDFYSLTEYEFLISTT